MPNVLAMAPDLSLACNQRQFHGETDLHLVAPEVVVRETFEPFAEFFAGGFFGDGAGNFRAF